MSALNKNEWRKFYEKKIVFFYFKVENIFNFYNKEERLFLILFKIN